MSKPTIVWITRNASFFLLAKPLWNRKIIWLQCALSCYIVAKLKSSTFEHLFPRLILHIRRADEILHDPYSSDIVCIQNIITASRMLARPCSSSLTHLSRWCQNVVETNRDSDWYSQRRFWTYRRSAIYQLIWYKNEWLLLLSGVGSNGSKVL